MGSWTSQNWFLLLPFTKGFVREVDIRHLSHLGLRRFPSRRNKAYSVQNLSQYFASMAAFCSTCILFLGPAALEIT